ncbi:DUF1002 domain-containing protein [Neobacillus sp. D3-1R]|uniref:DUF1002 domain-containing protein n=1 Tax=Neobacillus sp. D3-1R TaxID=3445778 RepID=UPI003FA04242
MKGKMAILCIIALLLTPIYALADTAEGDVIITLGEDLDKQQKEVMLKELNGNDNSETITVSNAEERKYLGDLIPKAQLGTRAISSSSITYTAKGTGLEVETHNINWVTKDMYLNALITAGVKDAKIKVVAPFEVSGTAALTGLIKAYEVSSDEVIPEDVKKVANQEMIETAKLGDKIGAEDAAALMAKIKEEMAKNAPQSDAELRGIIEQAAKELGISLTEEQIQSLMDLFNKMKELNIDWNQVGEQLNQAREKMTKFLQSEEGQTFLTKLKDFFVSIIEAIKALFS